MYIFPDVFIIPMLHMFIPIGTAAMRLKDIINIYLAVLVLKFILSHVAVNVLNANSAQFSEISLRTSHVFLYYIVFRIAHVFF
jgi:hypothetical protein